MLSWKLDKMAKANLVSKDDDYVLKRALMLEVTGQRKQGRPKQTWRRQAEESVKRIGMEVEEAANQIRWKQRVRAMSKE